MATTAELELNFPEKFDETVEAALDVLRAMMNDPTTKLKPEQQVETMVKGMVRLLMSIDTEAAGLDEARIMMQTVGLMSAVYYLNMFSPGEWVQETTTDFKRAYTAILLLKKLAPKEAGDR